MIKKNKKYIIMMSIVLFPIYFGLYKNMLPVKIGLYIWVYAYFIISILACLMLHSIMRQKNIPMVEWKDIHMYHDDTAKFLINFAIGFIIIAMKHNLLGLIFVLNFVTSLIYRERNFKIRNYRETRFTSRTIKRKK